jgi:hypothetical protein
MALLVLAGVVIGLYLRHNSRERSMQRRLARAKSQRKARTVATDR